MKKWFLYSIVIISGLLQPINAMNQNLNSNSNSKGSTQNQSQNLDFFIDCLQRYENTRQGVPSPATAGPNLQADQATVLSRYNHLSNAEKQEANSFCRKLTGKVLEEYLKQNTPGAASASAGPSASNSNSNSNSGVPNSNSYGPESSNPNSNGPGISTNKDLEGSGFEDFQLVEGETALPNPSQADLQSDKFQHTPVAGWYIPKSKDNSPESAIKELFGISAYGSNGSTSPGIRNAFFYAPAQINANTQPIVIVVVHGTGINLSSPLGYLTFKSGGAATGDYYDINEAGFKGILSFAKSQADRLQVPVQVVSYQWSGANNSTVRIEAGKTLRAILKKYTGFKIITLSHSHGGNVVNVASSTKDSPFIDTMIQVATPVRNPKTEEGIYTPKNFGTLFQFWSSDDWTVPIGAVSSWHEVLTGSIFRNANRSIRKFVSAAERGKGIPEQGYDPIDTPPSGLVYNIRTQINGTLPGHSFISILAPALSTVIRTILDVYKVHTDLDLNIDTKTNTALIAIRHPLTESIYFKDFLEPREKKSGSFALKLFNAALEEEEYSQAAKKIYFNLYGKDITANDPLARGIIRTITSKIPTSFPGASTLASYLPSTPNIYQKYFGSGYTQPKR